MKTLEITSNSAPPERMRLVKSGPLGRGAAERPAPRPSSARRWIYFGLGLLALGAMFRREPPVRPHPEQDLLPRLRNAGF